MPYEKDVQERQWWWCPKWYWPFAVCSGIRTQHKWCYNFSWVKETRYGFVGALEGCENGKLYTWTRPVLGVGSSYYPAGEMCFDSSLGSDEGRCDSSREGMLASGLSASSPYASSIGEVVNELRSDVVESGSFDFSGEHKRLCQEGVWPWSRTLHEQSITASVTTRFANVQWYVGGTALVADSGTIAVTAYCSWPFPLPSGRSRIRTVKVRYEIQVAPNHSTLILYNDPKDGTYSISIAMAATDADTGQRFASDSNSANFCGETCDFDPTKEAELVRCLKAFKDRYHQVPRLGPPSPEPVFVIEDEIWKLTPKAKTDVVMSILEVMKATFQVDSDVFTQAAMLLANRINVPDISRFWSLRLADASNNRWREPINMPACGCEKNLISVVAVLGIGLLAWHLIRRPRA